MATKTLNVKISQRYDTLENWQNYNPKLIAGEMALVQIGTEQKDVNGNIIQIPCYMAKIGTPDNKNFNDLPWLSGLASNVADWALASTKPSYSAQEITGLDDYIGEHASDVNTQYRLEVDANDSNKYYLQSCDDTTAENPVWTTVSTLTIPTITTGTTAGTIKVNETEVAVAGWDTLSTQVQTNTDAIATLNGPDTTEGSVANTVKTATETIKTEIQDEIASQISTVYKPAGSIAPAELVAGLLVEANEGKVYNVTGSFTTTTDFVEGADKNYPIGSNVVIVNTAAEGEEAAYRFDVLAGFIDLSDYARFDEVDEAIDNAIKGLTADQLPDIPTTKIENFDQSVTNIVNEELTKEPAEGEEKPAIQTTIETISKEQAEAAIADLDVADTAVEGEFIYETSEENGLISVKR